MPIKLKDETIKLLENSLIDDFSEKNPFFRNGEGLFMKYDNIRIKKKSENIFEVDLQWKGETVYTLSASCNFERGETLNIGMDGKMKTTISLC